MLSTASDVLIESLHNSGMDTIFGIPQSQANGTKIAFTAAEDKAR